MCYLTIAAILSTKYNTMVTQYTNDIYNVPAMENMAIENMYTELFLSKTIQKLNNIPI